MVSGKLSIGKNKEKKPASAGFRDYVVSGLDIADDAEAQIVRAKVGFQL